MKRTISETRVSDRQVRFKIRIEDVATTPGMEAEARLAQFMMEIAQVPDLLNCGYRKPQKLVFQHNGQNWVAEGEALVDR